jgi:hypothetical protein
MSHAQGTVSRTAPIPPSYYRARYYDPAAGRFLSEDKIRSVSGTLNFYENKTRLRTQKSNWGVLLVTAENNEGRSDEQPNSAAKR